MPRDAYARSQLPSVVAKRRALRDAGGYRYEFPSKRLAFGVCVPLLFVISWMYMRALYAEYPAYWVAQPKYLTYLGDGAEILYHYHHWLAPYYAAAFQIASRWERCITMIGTMIHLFFRPNFFICAWRVWWCYGFSEGLRCWKMLYHSGCDEPMTYGKYMTGCMFFGAVQRMPLEAQQKAFRQELLEAASQDMENMS